MLQEYQQHTFAFQPAPTDLADLLTTKPYAPWTRETFLHNVRANMLGIAEELEQHARAGVNLPADGSLPAIRLAADHPMCAGWLAHAQRIRAEYLSADWMPRHLAKWEADARARTAREEYRLAA